MDLTLTLTLILTLGLGNMGDQYCILTCNLPTLLKSLQLNYIIAIGH